LRAGGGCPSRPEPSAGIVLRVFSSVTSRGFCWIRWRLALQTPFTVACAPVPLLNLPFKVFIPFVLFGRVYLCLPDSFTRGPFFQRVLQCFIYCPQFGEVDSLWCGFSPPIFLGKFLFSLEKPLPHGWRHFCVLYGLLVPNYKSRSIPSFQSKGSLAPFCRNTAFLHFPHGNVGFCFPWPDGVRYFLRKVMNYQLFSL